MVDHYEEYLKAGVMPGKSKQEEIREGMAKIIYNYTTTVEADDFCLNELLWYLHENGVVIKVDRELPKDDEEVWERIMEKYNYVAVESLIEESK